jgi:hypothetical protein
MRHRIMPSAPTLPSARIIPRTPNTAKAKKYLM